MLSAAWVVAVTVSLQSSPPSATPTAPNDDQPFTHLTQNLAHDLKGMSRRGSAAILAAGLGGATLVHPSDDEVADWVRRRGNTLTYTPIGGLIGNEWLQGGAAIGTYVIGRVQHSPTLVHIGSDLVRAQILNGVLTTGLKIAVGRDRPDGGDHAFPSGHSSATFASAAVLEEHFGWKVGIPAYAAASFVGWTRIRDNQHWVTDVIFGSALGIVSGKAVAAGHKPSNWLVTPAITPGGGAIYFVKR